MWRCHDYDVKRPFIINLHLHAVCLRIHAIRGAIDGVAHANCKRDCWLFCVHRLFGITATITEWPPKWFLKLSAADRPLRCMVLFWLFFVLVLVLDGIQYSNPAHWSASSREPLRSTIGIAAVQTAIEYEYRPPQRTEYRFAEYEYDEIQCEARTKRSPRTSSCVTSIRDAVSGRIKPKNSSLVGMPQAPGWLAQPEA